MTCRVLILRPELGASKTAERARALGLEAVAAPIFRIAPLGWEAPEPDPFDAVLLTSANAARCAGPELLRFMHLPCYAVGEATAAAATKTGFSDVRTGQSDGAAVATLMAANGVRSALHLCGQDHVALDPPGLRMERRIVYRSTPVSVLPEEASLALDEQALVLIHSPRAGLEFSKLVEPEAKERIALAAISEAAASAAGPGWKGKAVASQPRDHALLELAVKLCKTGRPGIESDA